MTPMEVVPAEVEGAAVLQAGSAATVMSAQLRPSCFNMTVRTEDGGLLVFNSFSTSLLQFEGETAGTASEMLRGLRPAVGELADLLASQGVLVAAGSREREAARYLHELPFSSDEHFALMLMPHENCNFRCKYCYEDFEKGKMKPEVVDGVVQLLRKKIPNLRTLSIGWFGGEPLLALDVIEHIATCARQICAEHGVAYSSEMTTNGFLLDSDRLARCIGSGITRYQITLDGPAITHNTTRIRVNGGGTFDRILASLRNMRDHAHGFHVVIRVNFGPASLAHMRDFIGFLGREFGNDPRFSMRFRPIGRWRGDDDDHQLPTCNHDDSELQEINLMSMALNAGFGLQTWAEGMKPFGSACYAANPQHYVIGSDGMVYKCTVAFRDPRNHVGRIDAHGELNLRDDLVRLWTHSGEESDSGCRSCSFRPACQGNLCPLERLDKRDKRCPTTKTHIETILPLLAYDAHRSFDLAS